MSTLSQPQEKGSTFKSQNDQSSNESEVNAQVKTSSSGGAKAGSKGRYEFGSF